MTSISGYPELGGLMSSAIGERTGGANSRGISPADAVELQRRTRLVIPVFIGSLTIGELLSVAAVDGWGPFASATPWERVLPPEAAYAAIFVPLAWIVAFVWRAYRRSHPTRGGKNG